MPLPKIEVPKYELTIPSSGKQVKFRPFLVREEKVLLIAMEADDDKQMMNAVKDIITNCVYDEVNVDNMPLFDIEYIFLRIRAKSVGERVKLNLLCPDDEETQVEVEIDLEEVNVQMNVEHSNIVKITEDVSIVMKYPNLKDTSGFTDVGEVKALFDMIKKCIHEIHDGETVYNIVDVSNKDLDDFIDSMSTENFETLSNFFETMPKLIHVIEVKNPNTKKKVEIPIEGLQSFFA